MSSHVPILISRLSDLRRAYSPMVDLLQIERVDVRGIISAERITLGVAGEVPSNCSKITSKTSDLAAYLWIPAAIGLNAIQELGGVANAVANSELGFHLKADDLFLWIDL